MVVLNSPAKVAFRRAIAVTSEGLALALARSRCRFYVGIIEPYVSSYCLVLVVLAGFSSVFQ